MNPIVGQQNPSRMNWDLRTSPEEILSDLKEDFAGISRLCNDIKDVLSQGEAHFGVKVSGMLQDLDGLLEQSARSCFFLSLAGGLPGDAKEMLQDVLSSAASALSVHDNLRMTMAAEFTKLKAQLREIAEHNAAIKGYVSNLSSAAIQPYGFLDEHR